MAGCTDRRFEKMLFAYELGMLSDEDRAAVEMHQLECDYCFNKSKQFNEAIELLTKDPAVRDKVHQIAQTEDDCAALSSNVNNELRTKSKISSNWLRTSLAAAAVLLILVLQPWKIEIGPWQDAFAAEDILAIMNFGNLADSSDRDKPGEIISNLLIADLSESQHIQILSSQRLFDILSMLGQAETERISDGVAFLAAKKGNCRWLITGNILQVNPVYVVASRIVEVSSGKILSTQKIVGDTGMSIFALADSLSVQIRNDLPLSMEVVNEPDQMVSAITTNSQEAYRYYIEGVDYYRRLYYAEAVERFEKALDYDSTFAMVYYYLSDLKDYGLIRKAVEYSDKATLMEKLYITSRQAYLLGNIPAAQDILKHLINNYPHEKRAYFLLGSYEYNLENYVDAVNYLNKCLELDPLFSNAYNMLSYAYGHLDNFDQALEMSDKLIFLSPNEPNTYDSRGDIYKMFRMYDKAVESYMKAIAKKKDFYASWRSLGLTYTYMGDFVNAERCFNVIASVEDIYIWTDGKVYLGYNLIYQGKFDQALTMLKLGSQEDKRVHGEEYYATYHNLQALIYEELGKYDLALAELDRANEISERRYSGHRFYWRQYNARIVANSGNIERAEIIVGELKSALEESGRPMGDYWYARGSIDLARGNFEEAEEYFRKAIAEAESFDYASSLMFGLSLYNSGKFNESIRQFEDLIAAQDSLPQTWESWDVRVYYYLGLACEKAGELAKAAEQYSKYISIRKDADSDIESVGDARKRLTSLVS